MDKLKYMLTKILFSKSFSYRFCVSLGSLAPGTILFLVLLASPQVSYAKSSLALNEQAPSNLAGYYTQALEQVPAGLPLRLNIPKLRVKALVESVGLTTDGAVGVPKGPNNVAWYNLGPRPGEVGSAVISGHYGWKNNIPAVFDYLFKLKKGDKVYIQDDRGTTTVFIVRKTQIYDQNAEAAEVFNSSDGQAHLNLVTCLGTWNKFQKSYSQRLVVFADRE